MKADILKAYEMNGTGKLILGRCNGLQVGFRCEGFQSVQEAIAVAEAHGFSVRPVYYGTEWVNFLEITQ